MAVFLPTLYSGGAVSLMGKFDVQKWLERAQAEGITHTMLVPVQYRRLMQFERFDDYDLSAMKMKYCTSAPFPADLKAEMLARMPGGLIEIYWHDRRRGGLHLPGPRTARTNCTPSASPRRVTS